MIRTDEETRTLRATLARLNARAWGSAIGLLLGGGLFLATLVLVLQNGPNMGQHLVLLRVYLPGFSVSVGGSFIGFIYGFVIGYALGRIIGTVHNRLVGPA